MTKPKIWYQCDKCPNIVCYSETRECPRCHNTMMPEKKFTCGRVNKKWNFKRMKYDYITCGNEAQHEVPFGEFGGMPFCDKHYEEFQNDPKAQDRFRRVR